MVRIKSARHVHDYVVAFIFTDGSEREIDLEPYLHGRVFEPMRASPDEFRKFRVDRQYGTIVWPNGVGIDPDTLYLNLTPAAWEASAL